MAAETTPGVLVTVIPKKKDMFVRAWLDFQMESSGTLPKNSKRTFGGAGIDIIAIVSGVRNGDQRDTVGKVGDKLLVERSPALN